MFVHIAAEMHQTTVGQRVPARLPSVSGRAWRHRENTKIVLFFCQLEIAYLATSTSLNFVQKILNGIEKVTRKIIPPVFANTSILATSRQFNHPSQEQLEAAY